MIATIRKVLAEAREQEKTPLHIDFLVAANAAVWGTVLALMAGGLLS
jgi:hypothetical protein